jgi:hypothetical protein
MNTNDLNPIPPAWAKNAAAIESAECFTTEMLPDEEAFTLDTAPEDGVFLNGEEAGNA